MTPRERPDFSHCVAYIKRSIEAKQRGERVKDFDHYVFELALEAVYGATCWDEYNKLGASDD